MEENKKVIAEQELEDVAGGERQPVNEDLNLFPKCPECDRTTIKGVCTNCSFETSKPIGSIEPVNQN